LFADRTGFVPTTLKGFPQFDGLLSAPKASLAYDRAPAFARSGQNFATKAWYASVFFTKTLKPSSPTGGRMLSQKPGPQFFFFDNRHSLDGMPHPATKRHKSLVRSFSTLTKRLHLALPRPPPLR